MNEHRMLLLIILRSKIDILDTCPKNLFVTQQLALIKQNNYQNSIPIKTFYD